MAQSFESWWNSQGPVTKFTLCVCILLTALSSFGYVSMFDYLLTYELLFREPWRIFTSTFYFGDFGIGFVFNLAFLVIYQKRLEDEDYPLGFHGRTADHVWLMLAIVLVLVPLALLMNLPIISVSFSMGIVWIWCKRHEDQELTFYGFSFKAAYFPWVLTLIHMLMGASPLRGIAGIVCMSFFLAGGFLGGIMVKNTLKNSWACVHCVQGCGAEHTRLEDHGDTAVHVQHLPPAACRGDLGWGCAGMLAFRLDVGFFFFLFFLLWMKRL